MKKIKIKAIIAIVLICVFVIASVSIFNFAKSYFVWQPLSETKQYEEICRQPITQIALREYPTSTQWVVFNDDDLISQWEEFLNSAEIKREKILWGSVSARLGLAFDGGAPLVAEIKTQTTTKSVYINLDNDGIYTLEIDCFRYALKSDVAPPFHETFDIAVERHGITTPWD